MLTAFPALHIALKIAGGAYLALSRLAHRHVALDGAPGRGSARPMTFLEAAAFQWVNPEGLGDGGDRDGGLHRSRAALPDGADRRVAFALVNLPSVSIWAGFGMALRGFLADPVRLKWFNIAMGVLLVATLCADAAVTWARADFGPRCGAFSFFLCSGSAGATGC